MWTERRIFSRWEAWEDLMMEAHWNRAKPKRQLLGGKSYEIFYGQVLWSIRFMASRWTWSKSRVERFLGWLKTETAITTLTETHAIRITLCNYELYQGKRDTIEDTDRDTHEDTGGTQAGRRRDEKKK